jgi:UDP-glucose-4-epimerase GalE
LPVLVTGGAGYVGSHTVRRLIECGEKVVVLDNLTTGHRASIGDAELIMGDIDDVTSVLNLCDRFEIDEVIHLAASKAPAESMVVPLKYFRNNVAASITLFEALLMRYVRRIVFSSSCAVYGTPERLPVTEEELTRPESPYGESKLMVEQVLDWLSRRDMARYVSLRYFNAAGAALDGGTGEDWSKTQNLIPLAMKAALGRSGPLRVFGTDYATPDGSAIRDYVHVLDLADAHVKALHYLRGGGRSVALNLGRGLGSSVFDVLACLERVSGRAVPMELVSRRAGDPPALWADTARAMASLQWSARYDLTEMVASAWRWHSRHPTGYPDAPAPRTRPVSDSPGRIGLGHR